MSPLVPARGSGPVGTRLRNRAALRHLGRGQATVEFSLVIGVLSTLVFGLVDFGHMVAMHAAAVTASREAARYGSAIGDSGAGVPQYVDCAGIRDAARRVTSGLIALPDDRIRISFDDGAGSPVSAACPPHGGGPVAAQISRMDRVVVEVTLTYEAISPIRAFVGPVTVVSIDRRAIVKGP